MSFKFLFEVNVANGQDEEFIEHWTKGSIPIQELPGAMGTRLHKKRGEEHAYIAIAEWESYEARQAAMQAINGLDAERTERVHQWRDNEAFGTVTIIGEIDEISIVLPPQ